jgi:hypothetical protein
MSRILRRWDRRLCLSPVGIRAATVRERFLLLTPRRRLGLRDMNRSFTVAARMPTADGRDALAPREYDHV